MFKENSVSAEIGRDNRRHDAGVLDINANILGDTPTRRNWKLFTGFLCSADGAGDGELGGDG